jgi:alpha-tubulin suppressor-like RCC1 family protein
MRGAALVTILASAQLTFSSVFAGYNFTCALTPLGKAYCWGQNPFGELGIGVHAPLAEWTPAAVAPLPVVGDLTFASISVGGWHACGLTTDQSVFCWGLGLQRQLGQSGSSDVQTCELSAERVTPCATTPTAVSGVPPFRAVYAGGLHTCALTPNGTAYCWGGDRYGQLGDGGGVTAHGLPPTPVAGNLTFASLSAGFRHVCGLTTDGKAYCWGYNYHGQLGDGSNVNRDVPVPVAGDLTFMSLSALVGHTCGLTTTGDAYCWGDNYYGQLGDGSQSARYVPTAVLGGPFTSLLAGEFHTCGVAETGAAYCWGANWNGRLGSGPGPSRTEPAVVAGGFTFAAITVSTTHSCGVTTSGVAYCWGSNQSGQLGDGSATSRDSPARVAGQP